MNSDARQATAAQTLALGEQVVDVLEQQGHAALIIGGFALFVHHYARTTEDLDLGVATHVADLWSLRKALLGRGFAVDLRLPDSEDPLGGVIDVEDDTSALVQIINFNAPSGGQPKVILDAVAVAEPWSSGSRLRVVPLAHLIALKLYAADQQSLDDVRELLKSNPDADIAAIKALCEGYGLATDALDL